LQPDTELVTSLDHGVLQVHVSGSPFPERHRNRVAALYRSRKHLFDSTVRLRLLLSENRICIHQPPHPTIKNGALLRIGMGCDHVERKR